MSATVWLELAFPIKTETDDGNVWGEIDAPPEVKAWIEARMTESDWASLHEQAREALGRDHAWSQESAAETRASYREREAMR